MENKERGKIIYSTSDGGFELYGASQFKFTEAVIDEDASLIRFGFFKNGKKKWCEISFDALQKFMEGVLQ